MKSGTAIWKFPFVSRKKHEKVLGTLNDWIDEWNLVEKERELLHQENERLREQVYQLKRTRNAKGQFERRAKV